jgi:hypothetical protein
MDTSIPAVLVQERMSSCQSRLDEITTALGTELGKPMHHRDPRVLTFLECQKQKFAFSIALLSELLGTDRQVGAAIELQSE